MNGFRCVHCRENPVAATGPVLCGPCAEERERDFAEMELRLRREMGLCPSSAKFWRQLFPWLLLEAAAIAAALLWWPR
jgi:hypothetical protein